MLSHIKLYRELLKKAFYTKDSEKVHLWIHLLLSANWCEREEFLGGKPIICKPGQFTTGRKQISTKTGISESKIERILTYFEKIEQQIEQQKTSTNRLITILNWNIYQESEQQNEQQVNNDRTTSEQRVNNDRTHYKNIKKGKNIKKEYTLFSHELQNFSIEYFENKYLNDKSLDLFDKLILDGYTPEKIKEAIKLARGDTFWDSNFLSPQKLRSKDKSGVFYIDKFLKIKPNGNDKSNNPKNYYQPKWEYKPGDNF